MNAIACKHCVQGTMKKRKIGRHNISLQVLGVVVFIVGVCLLFLFPIGTVIGLLLMIAAARMGYSKKKVWLCDQCGHFVERA